MLADLHIRNYRLFDDLTIGGLKRVNLLIGKNNSGKSTVLEAAALLAAGYSPEVLAHLNRERAIQLPESEPAFEQYLRSFFRDLDASKDLVITATDVNRYEWTLTAAIKRSPVSTVTGDRPEVNSFAGTSKQDILVLRQEDGDGGWVESKTTMVDKDAKFKTQDSVDPPPRSPYAVSYVPSNVQLPDSDAALLSGLRRDKRTEVVLDVLRRIAPTIQDLPEVLMVDGAPQLYCDIGASRLLPLRLMGQGLVRVLRLALTLEQVSPSPAAGRLLMIDEIENGMHHEALVDVWRAVAKATHRSDTQVFATTHSYECLQSASKAVSPEDLAIHRLEVNEDRTVRCVTLDPEAIKGTMHHGFEVR